VEMSALFSSPSTQTLEVLRLPEAIEAHHGLCTDGGLGSLTLTENVALGVANSGHNKDNTIASTVKKISI